MYYLLLYDYVDNAVERRAPFRAAHLGLVRDYVERGQIILGGAFEDPVDGAAIVFKVESKLVVEQFVERDPYAQNGLVTAWRARPWTVVVGTAMEQC